MLLEPILVVELAVLGTATGFLAGLLGIGGGMLMVPFITIIMSNRGVAPDLAVKMAIATSMATIMFTSVSSVWAHHKRGAVRWDIVKRLSPGIVGLFVGFSATQMFLDKKPEPSRHLPGTSGLLAAGSLIGFLSGLVGAGGAFISVPFMTWCNVAIRNAVATSAALGFPIAVANVFGYIISGFSVQNLPAGAFGYIWLPALAVIAVCSFLMAPLGAKAAHTLPIGKLKRIFASILYVLAAYMLYKGIAG